MTLLLLAKLIIAPAFVGLASLAMRLWGGIIAGMMSGFPQITAPVAFFRAVEQGPEFARQSAISIQFAMMGVTSYAIVYGLLINRFRWPVCQGLAVLAYFVVSLGAVYLPGGSWVAGTMAMALVAIGLATLASPAGPVVRPPLPWWDLWLRVAVTIVIILVATAAANHLGPRLSAIFASYPAISSVVTPFAHARGSADVARDVVRGILLSHISFALLFAIVAATLPALGIAISYAVATIAAVIASLIVVWGDRHLSRRLRSAAMGRS